MVTINSGVRYVVMTCVGYNFMSWYFMEWVHMAWNGMDAKIGNPSEAG